MNGRELTAAIEQKIRASRAKPRMIEIPKSTGEKIRDAFGPPPDSFSRDALPKVLFGFPVRYRDNAPRDGRLVVTLVEQPIYPKEDAS